MKGISLWVTFGIISGICLTLWSRATDRPNWDIASLNTAVNVNYLSENEKAVILEINKLRSNPYMYAVEYLEPMLTMYKGKMLYMPGNDPIITHEGIIALKDAIAALKKANKAAPLLPDKRLTLAARDHQQDQSRTGQTGHKGSNGSSISDRIERHGTWDRKISENIFYGDTDARSVVLHLVIDDGVPSRGHRINFLDPELKYVGVACGTHKKYRFLCVMNFAAAFKNSDAAKK